MAARPTPPGRVTPSGAWIWTGGPLALKAHRRGTAPHALAWRLSQVRRPDAAQLWAPLMLPVAVPVPVPRFARLAGASAGCRRVTCWRRLMPLDPAADEQPWAEAGALLAELHRLPAPASGPPHRAVERLRRAVRRLHFALDRLPGPDRRAAEVVRAAGDFAVRQLSARDRPPGAPAPSSDRPRTLVHGDWHLGQLGRLRPGAPLRLLDVDDLGVGDPAWDLARPAGFWAAGLLDDASWNSLLHAYRERGGPAVPPDGDPWPALELPARSAVVVAAARALGLGADPAQRDDVTAAALIAACADMPNQPPASP